MSARPALVVPSHNGAHLLAGLLPSLAAQTLVPEVVVVDNASTDGTRGVIESLLPAARIVTADRNLGFGRAVNRGVAATDARTVVVVNNDVVCEPTFVERLVAALAPDRHVVMAAGVLLDGARPGHIDTAGVVFDRTLFALDHLHGEPVQALEAASEPLGPSGGAAAYARAAFDEVGGFDERFFAYLEDVDLAVRLIANEGRCRLAAGARAVHRHSATLGAGSRRKNALMGWGRGYTLGKYRVHRRPAAFARASIQELVVAAGQIVLDGNAAGVAARIRGFRAGLAANAEPLPPLPPRALEITLRDGLAYRLSRRRPPSRRSAQARERAPL